MATVCAYESPYGPVALTVSAGRLVRVELSPANGPAPDSAPPAARPYVAALAQYFDGGDLPANAALLDMPSVTPFRRRVLRQLLRVGRGELVTYGELAARVGVRQGARAVGGAVGRNPLPIFVPCHRVVAAAGRLGGFGAGLTWKANLLQHEGWTVKGGRVL